MGVVHSLLLLYVLQGLNSGHRLDSKHLYRLSPVSGPQQSFKSCSALDPGLDTDSFSILGLSFTVCFELVWVVLLSFL